ncbi:MAG: nitroreductase family deazaflavin-dependent oxidoreductase [Nitrospinae bacterium]|nr:nitroreductase family deazaflavin-dependent oxidoreductase [Nitrospinota bacterium]
MGLADKKPKGFLRWALRAPVWLFRLRLGWLMVGHFLMVTTTGRKSGRPRYAVIEVIKRDKVSRAYIVVSGWGVKSDWYQNILQTPQVRVDVGFRHFQARAEVVEAEQAASLLADYARRFPFPFRQLAKALTGESVTGTPDECARLVSMAPLVAFIPVSLGQDAKSRRTA